MTSRTSTHYVRKLLGGLTCEEFAQEFGIPLGTVRNWDARKTFPVYMEALVLRAASSLFMNGKYCENCGADMRGEQND